MSEQQESKFTEEIEGLLFKQKFDEVKPLIEEGKIPINEVGRYGRVMLNVVARGPYRKDDFPDHQAKALEFAKYLVLEKKADVNAGKTTPVHEAVKEHNEDMAIFLLENGAKYDTLDADNEKNLFLAAISENCVKVFKYLLAKDPALVTSSVSRGYCKMTPLRIASVNGEPEIFNPLLEAGADVNAVDGDGWSITFTLALNGHLELLKNTIAKGGKLNARESDGASPLHMAAGAGELEIIKFLLSEEGGKMDVNVVDKKLMTPLMIASKRGKIDVMELLLSNGAKTDMVCAKGRNVYDWGNEAWEEEPILAFWKSKGVSSAVEAAAEAEKKKE